MDLNEFEWRRWPLAGAGAARASDTPAEKAASEAPDVSVEFIATRAVAMMRAWAEEMPAGIDKVAAQREGDQGELPLPTKDTIWRHPNAHPAAMCLILLDRYGDEMLEWEPEVLLKTLERDKIVLSNASRTKILAARVVLQSPSPWRQWEVLHWVSLGLAGKQPNFVYLEDPELGHIVSGYDFMKLVDPERDTTDEVDKFIAAVFKNEGLPFIPAPLDFAQRELEDPQIKCSSCEAVHRDDNDQRCVACGSPQLIRLTYEYAELRDEVKRMWNELKALPLEIAVDKAPDSPAGNAVYTLLIHWDYANQVRTHMAQQLRMLGDLR